MIVEVGPEIEQLVFEIRARPDQRAIEILAAKGPDGTLHEWMAQGNGEDGFDLGHLQDSQIGLLLVEPISGSWSELRCFGIER